jgi:hypothetical protein
VRRRSACRRLYPCTASAQCVEQYAQCFCFVALLRGPPTVWWCVDVRSFPSARCHRGCGGAARTAVAKVSGLRRPWLLLPDQDDPGKRPGPQGHSAASQPLRSRLCHPASEPGSAKHHASVSASQTLHVCTCMKTVQEKLRSGVDRELVRMEDRGGMWVCVSGAKGHQSYILRSKNASRPTASSMLASWDGTSPSPSRRSARSG